MSMYNPFETSKEIHPQGADYFAHLALKYTAGKGDGGREGRGGATWYGTKSVTDFML